LFVDQAPISRPSGRYAVGLCPSLDPDAYLDVCGAVEDSPNLRSLSVLTRPYCFRDDLLKHRPASYDISP
jgi:hypothetical protein